MVSQAKARSIPSSAQKTRLVVDLIRGKDVGAALAILRATTKRVSKDIEKLLNSAVANAQNREERVDVDRLFVAKAWVDEAPSVTRGRAGSMGRYFPRTARKSHVTLQLDVRR